MSTIHINLPETMKAYLTEQAARRGYADASEFVQNLIEADRHRRLKDEVESMLMESINGPFSDWQGEDLENIRDAGQRMINRRKSR